MNASERFWQIDLWRGITVVLMVFFNWSFTLFFLDVYKLNFGDFYWRVFPQFIGGSFIFLAGLSIVLSSQRLKLIIYKKYFFRGSKIFLLGIGITIVTWLFSPSNTIVFGILHLIGISIVLSPLFLKIKGKLFIAALFLILGFYFQSIFVNSSYLFPIGLVNPGFTTLDYWPFVPWFGIFLVGMYFGDIFIKIKNPGSSDNKLAGLFCILGRNSLKVYLVHQPMLLAILIIFGAKVFI